MTPRLLQLYSLRAQVEALIAMEQAETMPDPVEPGDCQHPEERRVNAQTMGGPPQFYCQACKSMVQG